jgi:hypothetical protein
MAEASAARREGGPPRGGKKKNLPGYRSTYGRTAPEHAILCADRDRCGPVVRAGSGCSRLELLYSCASQCLRPRKTELLSGKIRRSGCEEEGYSLV